YFPRFSERRRHRIGPPLRSGLDPPYGRYGPGLALTIQRRPACLGGNDQCQSGYAGWALLLLARTGSGDPAVRRTILTHAIVRAYGPATHQFGALSSRASGSRRTIHRARVS